MTNQAIELTDEQYMQAGMTAVQTLNEEYGQTWDAHGNPFDEPAAEFKLKKSVNFHQLVGEIQKVLDGCVGLQIVATHPSTPEGFDALQQSSYEVASEDHPAYLYIIPTTIDIGLVQNAIRSHNPNAQWDMTPEQLKYEILLTKLQGGEELSPVEVQDALRALLSLIKA